MRNATTTAERYVREQSMVYETQTQLTAHAAKLGHASKSAGHYVLPK
jgi:hypothetical protein